MKKRNVFRRVVGTLLCVVLVLSGMFSGFGGLLYEVQEVHADIVEATAIPGGYRSTWQITDDGELILGSASDAPATGGKLPNRAVNFGTNPPGQADLERAWPWQAEAYKDKITKISIDGTLRSDSSLRFAFYGLPNLKEVDLSGFVSNETVSADAANDMFRDCTSLETVTFANTFNPRQYSRMFQGCTNLKKVTFGTESAPFNPDRLTNRSNMFESAGTQSGAIELYMPGITISDKHGEIFTAFANVPYLVENTINLTGAVIPANRAYVIKNSCSSGVDHIILDDADLSAHSNLSQMFSNMYGLKSMSMAGDVDVSNVVNMHEMFYYCPQLESLDVSGFGKLGKIIDMGDFVKSDSALKYLNIDNLDNSNIQPTLANHTPNHHCELGLETCTSLETLSAKSTKVWMRTDDGGSPAGHQNWDVSSDSYVSYFTQNQIIFNSDAGPTETIATKRDYVDLIGDRTETGTRANGSNESSTNINTKDGHLNTNGAGYLAPGVYNILGKGWDEPTVDMAPTYYRITDIDNSTPTITLSDTTGILSHNASTGRVETVTKTVTDWNTLASGNAVVVKNTDDSPLITLTYPGAATDINGNAKDIEVTINKITFKDIDKIPNNPGRTHETNPYVDTDSSNQYKRFILEYGTGTLAFKNYVRRGNGNWLISGGSGTDIDFDIKVKDAKDNTSILFYMEDLDIPYSQTWIAGTDPATGEDDWCYDTLPFSNVTYGAGSESIILGDGNDLGTLGFAEHSGLEIINGNNVVPTGPDPNTAWSAFSVRADAQGSSYTWTSGVGCDTYLLRQTPPSDYKDTVYLFPEATKTVNNTTPMGDFADAFDFELEPANEFVTGNKALSDDPLQGSTVKNNGGNVRFDELHFTSPSGNNTDTYYFKITETSAATAADILKYNTGNAIYFLKVEVSNPEDDLELERGVKAVATVGRYYTDPSDPTAAIDTDKIIWDTAGAVTLWAADAQPVSGVKGPGGETVFEDNNGVQFYRADGKFYTYPTDTEIERITHRQADRKVNYDGGTYTVYEDANGVAYFMVQSTDSGVTTTKYLDPDTHEVLMQTKTGDVYPADDDKNLSEKKTVDVGSENCPIQVDVHGVEYVASGGKYYETDGTTEHDVKDGVFNPNTAEDRYVYQDWKIELDGTEYNVKEDVFGKKYVNKNDASGNLYNPDTQSYDLTEGTLGNVLPNASGDNTVKHDEQSDQILYVNGNPVLETKNATAGIRYYESGGKYYSVLGMVLTNGTGGFNPSTTDDEEVRVASDIMVDENGTQFYRSDGKYYDINGNDYHFPTDRLDTSDAIRVGGFANEVRTSEIVIKKEADNNRAGEFTFLISFDSGFQPTNYVFDPAAPLVSDDGNETPLQFVAVGDNTYKFTLFEGQKVTIKDVPFQTTYTITEPVKENGWELYKVDTTEGAKSASKKITEERYEDDGTTERTAWDYTHIFNNRFTELVIDKTVLGTNPDEEFRFNAVARVTGLEPNEEFTYGVMNGDSQTFYTAVANSSGSATITFDEFKLKDKTGSEEQKDIVLVLPRGARVKVTETPVEGYIATYKVDNGSNVEVDESGATSYITLDNEKHTLSFTNSNVMGTFGLKVTKNLDGRAFKAGDKFTFMLTAEDGTPLPVAYQGSNTFSAGEVTKEITTDTNGGITAGTVTATADFGTILVTPANLDAVEVTYGDATEAQKRAVNGEWVSESSSGGADTIYTKAIPDSAIATFTVAGEEVKVTYAEATAAQRSDTSAEWKSADGSIYKVIESGTTIPNDAKGIVYEKTFVYKVMENPKAGTADDKYITNDSHIAEIPVYVLWDPSVGKIYVSAADGAEEGATATKYLSNADGADATLSYNKSTEKFVDSKNTSGDFRAVVSLDSVVFTNEYDSEATWTPEAIKKLEGRELRASDSFTFNMKAVEEDTSTKDYDWVNKTPMPNGADATNGSTTNETDLNIRDGIAKFGDITYTNDDLLKKVTYEKATTAERQKAVSWTSADGKTVYGPIPDDATATVTVDGKAETVTYAAATDAQRKAAQGATNDSLWTKGSGNTAVKYIDYAASQGTGSAVTVPNNATGTFYETERVFTYKMSEVIPDSATATINGTEYTYSNAIAATQGTAPTLTEAEVSAATWEGSDSDGNALIYDTTVHEIEVTVKDEGNGVLTVTESHKSPATATTNEFTNTVVGSIKISATKDIEGANWDDAMNFWFTLEADKVYDSNGAEITMTPAPDMHMPAITRLVTNEDTKTATWELKGFDESSKGRTYTYTIKESEPNFTSANAPDGWEWSAADFTYTVAVIFKDANGDPTLTPTIRYYKSSDITTTTDITTLTGGEALLEVTNTAIGNKLNIHAVKKVTDGNGNGDYWKNGDEYTLVLDPVGGSSAEYGISDIAGNPTFDIPRASVPMPDDGVAASGAKSETANNSTAGAAINFGAIAYDDTVSAISSLGNGASVYYYYRITESIPNAAEAYDTDPTTGKLAKVDPVVTYQDAASSGNVSNYDAWKLNGVTYDSSVSFVRVKVSRDISGDLSSTVEYSHGNEINTEPAAFTNKYEAEAEVELNAKKVIEGADLSAFMESDGSSEPVSPFTFTLYDGDGNKLYRDEYGNVTTSAKDASNNDNDPITVSNDSTGKIKLGTFTYTEADVQALVSGTSGNNGVVKTYILREDIPADADKVKGIVYDVDSTGAANSHIITVTLSVESDGSIKAVAAGADGTAAADQNNSIYATIENTYDPTVTENFAVSKFLNNRPISRNGFNFTMKGLGTVSGVSDDATAKSVAQAIKEGTTTPTNTAPLTAPMPGSGTEQAAYVAPITNNYSANGSASFGPVEYTMENSLKKADGTYDTKRTFVYEITETKGDNAKIDYESADRTVYYVFVTVENDLSAGTLKTTKNYVKATKGDNNNWSYNSIAATDIEKTLTVAGTSATAIAIPFENIYDSEGEATVTAIKQIIGRDWTDNDKFPITIKAYEKVADTNNLTTSDIYSHIGGGTNTASGRVEPSKVPLPGNNITSDRTATGGTSGVATGEATIDGNDVGNGEHFADFDAITYTDDMLTWDSADGLLKGTFYYEINETIPATAKATIDGTDYTYSTAQAAVTAGSLTATKVASAAWVYNGFTYDARTFYAQVDVTDNRIGKLTTQVYYYSNASDLGDTSKQNHATPVFQNTYAMSDETEVPIVKQIDGRNWEDGDTFTFTIGAVNTAPLPATRTIDVKYDDDKVTAAGSTTPDETLRTDSFNIPITLSNLTWTTGTDGTKDSNDTYTSGTTIKDAAGTDLASGIKYGIFRYVINEDKAGETHNELTYADVPVYVEILAVDNLKGGVDSQITYYSDSAFTTKNTGYSFVNVYDTYAQNPAQILVKKVVKNADESERTWGSSDTYTFTIEPIGDAPATREFKADHDELATADEQTEITIGNTSSASWYTTDSTTGNATPGDAVTHAGTVSIPIKMSDLDKNATTQKPVATSFVYKITEESGSIAGIEYNTDPIYVKVTATPQADGTITLAYAYYSNEACTENYSNTYTIGTTDGSATGAATGTTTISGADGSGNGLVVTNKYGVTSLNVEKKWIDGKDSAPTTRPSISIHLMQQIEGESEATEIVSLAGIGATVTDKSGTELQYNSAGVSAGQDKLPITFNNLPSVTADGKAITYNVTEDDPTGYRLTKVEYGVTTEGNETWTEEKPESYKKIRLTNTLLTDINIIKEWHDEGDDKANRPDAVVAGLTQGSASFPSRFTPVQAREEWQAEFSDLLAYNESGAAISYTINEMGIPTGYSARVEYSADYDPEDPDEATWSEAKPEGWDTQVTKYVRIVNTKLKDVTIKKTWMDGAVENVTLDLYRSTEPSSASGIIENAETHLKNWTPDETWEKVENASYTFPYESFNYKTSAEGGSTREYTFNNLPAYDADGKEYTYRAHESTTSSFYETWQIVDLTVVNKNKYDATGGANPTVVKELDGRPWLDSDTFYFMIEPEMTGEEGSEVEKITDGEGNAVTVEGVETPMPKDGDTEKPVTTVTKNSAQVGAIGRSVNFADISFTNEDMLNADGSTASVRNFYYRIYEVADADGTPLTEVTEGGVLDGITYAGTGEGDEWKPEVHTLRIEVTDNGDGTLSTNRYWDGATSSSAVPVFTNKYSSEGVAKIWVEKQIETRNWTSDDEFKFTITGISGASLNIGGSDSGDTYTTRAMSLADVADPEEDSVQLSDTVVAMGIPGNPYKGEALNNGDAYFIYSITEDAGDVSDLAYDQSTIYVRMHVEDNWDGTLKFTAQYFSDAACTKEITGHEVWIVDDGTEKRLLELDEIEEAEAMSDEELKENGYRKVNAAHFVNTTSIDIPVTKVWEDGPAVEDVTVHLLRALFPLDVEDELSDDYVKANVDSKSLGGWERVGLANTFQRGEFESETEVIHLVSGFNKALPMYVTVGGTTYRAVYMLTEDDTSDAYEPSYKSIQPDNSEKEGDNIFIDSGEMVITNKVIAGNQANIAAVKQLLGRQWLDEDDFSFSLEPYGKGTYNEDGTFKSIEETKDIPMPEDNSDRMSKTEADKSKATTHATIDTDVVDTEGNMERLARFGAIEYSVNDLEYDPTDRHHQGDFFYKMKEVVPAASSDGMTYSTKESIVHVKVRENRTDNLTVQIAYDEKTLGDIATGTQFTPVFTNRYEATAEFTASLDKYIMGRTWEADDEFDFTMNPLAGAPFEDADKSQFPEQDTHTEAEREAGLASGKAIHNAEGAHVVRMTIPTASVGMDDEITIDFPSIVFRLSELGKTADEGQLKYSDGTAVPKGMAYGQYMYALEETKSNADDLSIDVDTEYVQVTVIDKGDGTLDLSSKIFEDRYAQVQRFEPDEDGNASTTPAKNVTFVNQLKRDLSVTKSWTDPANADVEMVLEWTTDNPASEASWNSAEGVSWLNGVTTTRVIKQTATGDDLTVTFKDLPAYQPDDDDLDLNNKWVYYRVVESTSGAFDTRYSEEAYESGKTLDYYSETPYYTEAEDADERVTELHVINFPNEVTGLAKVFVVKQLVGKDWTDESFNFVLTPIESKIGAETEAVPNSERALPMPAVDTATADSTTTPVGENEHNAVFGSIPISLSNLDVDPADGIAKGEFTYEVSEVIPSGQGDIKYTTDVHRVTITATNNGTGKVITSVSWDGREVGDFVPVYVNRWQPDTMSVSVRKVWDDANDQDGKRPEAGIAVKLLADGETALDKDGNEVTSIVLSENNNYVGTFENLPTLVDGDTVEYTVEEINVPEGYDSEIEGTAADGFVITNTYTPETTQVTATKVWTGDDEFGTDLRADVTLHLYGKQDGKIVFDGGEKTITMDESGEPEDEAEWTELPKYMNGEAIEWTVTEEAVLGYSGSVEESGTDGTEFTVTNEFVGPSDSVTVTKVWDDDDDRDSKRPETVKYELYKQLVGDSPELVETVEAIETPTDETLTTYPGQTADWGYEWTNLPTEEEQEGTMVPVFYTVKEVYSGTELETNGYDKPMVETTENGKFQITNPRTKFDTTKINIIKSWDDEHDADGIRPEYIRVKVIDGTKEVASAYLTEENKGVSSDIWTYTIEGLPMNRAKGEPIAYAVQEDAVTGYTATITKSVESTSNGTYTIVNTHSTTPMEYKTVEATKVWKDKDGKELSEAPLAVTFHLVKTVEGYGPIRVSGEDKTIAAGASGDELTVKWENLPAMEGGRNVEYNVEEDAVSGYTGSVLKTTGTSGKTIVTVTNKETSSTPTPGPGPGPDPGQQCDECDNRVSVTYVDPFASSDSDMFKTKMYGSADAAKTAAESGADAPADSSVKAPDGYKFAGWKPGYDEKGNIIMVATYEKIPVVDPTVDNTYIFVDGQTGEIIKSGTVEEDKEPTMPAGPSHDGMKFVEWTKIVDPVTGNVTYVAKYEPRTTCPDPVVPDPPTPVEKTHWVQYVDSDGTVYLEKVTIKDGESEPSAPANPTKDGFTFDGWSRTVDANGNVTYTAKWKENSTPTPDDPTPVEKTHWVEYVDPDGTVYLERVTLKDGEAEPAPPATPSKDGYNFEGWIRTVDANGNITYTAKWEEIKPTPVDPDKPDDPTPEKPDDPTPEKQWVRYIDKENNIIYMDKTELDANGKEPPAPADPTRDGYVFDGWTREVDEDGNITYTANWKPESNITPTPTPEKPAKDVPKTGDQSNATLWIGILVLAILIAAIAFLVRMRTKK